MVDFNDLDSAPESQGRRFNSYQRTLCCIFRSRSWLVLKCIYTHLDYKPFMRYKTRDDSFISDKAPTARVLNGLKNEPSYEFSGEVIFKINVV